MDNVWTLRLFLFSEHLGAGGRHRKHAPLTNISSADRYETRTKGAETDPLSQETTVIRLGIARIKPRLPPICTKLPYRGCHDGNYGRHRMAIGTQGRTRTGTPRGGGF